MTTQPDVITRTLVPSGALGIGFDAQALIRGLDRKPDIICIDGGSTDSGPFYLGTGTSKYSRAATKAQWRQLMKARADAGVPLVVGSCGTCGTDDTVRWMLEITAEVAAELGQRVKVATLYSSQAPARVAEALTEGQVEPLYPAPDISPESVAEYANVVALAGAEQIGAALDTGANIVLAGRTTDTATISALALKRGVPAGAAWHGAKIAECGALCTTRPTSGVILLEFDAEGFVVEPMAADARCTPHSVSAHMLYENADPFVLHEPGGYLDVTEARYESLDDRRVRVTDSRWVSQEKYTVKLEGAKAAGFQSTIMALLRDARYVREADRWVEQLQAFLAEQIEAEMGLRAEDYSLEFRLIGVNAALGELETKTSEPAEVGVFGIITASDQDTASEIGKLINPWVLHFPLTPDEEMPTFAFPYSPAQSERGPLYEFGLNHVMVLDDPMDAFRLESLTLGNGANR